MRVNFMPWRYLRKQLWKVRFWALAAFQCYFNICFSWHFCVTAVWRYTGVYHCSECSMKKGTQNMLPTQYESMKTEQWYFLPSCFLFFSYCYFQNFTGHALNCIRMTVSLCSWSKLKQILLNKDIAEVKHDSYWEGGASHYMPENSQKLIFRCDESFWGL